MPDEQSAKRTLVKSEVFRILEANPPLRYPHESPTHTFVVTQQAQVP
jgi:hypothetical protein